MVVASTDSNRPPTDSTYVRTRQPSTEFRRLLRKMCETRGRSNWYSRRPGSFAPTRERVASMRRYSYVSREQLSSSSVPAAYDGVRRQTEGLATPLTEEDCSAQSMPDASPVKWHLAHTTWFFETFVLEPHLPGYRALNPAFRTLFNSYYNGVGPQFARAQRGMLTRPTLDGGDRLPEARRCRDACADRLRSGRRFHTRSGRTRPESRAAASGTDPDGRQASVFREPARIPPMRSAGR